MAFEFEVVPSKTPDPKTLQDRYYISIRVKKAPAPGAYGSWTAPFKDWNEAVRHFRVELEAQWDPADKYEMDGKTYSSVADILRDIKMP